MSDCVFSKIIKGDLPCYKVYEDDKYFGLMDIHPLTLGNSLLIPKAHHRWVFDVPDFGEYFEVAKKIAIASEKVLNTESVSLLTLGYEVSHAHIRIIPRYPNDLHPKGINTTINVKTLPQEMKIIASKITALLNK